MNKKTDPARELADLLSTLAVQTNVRGDQFLANTFGVEVWSKEFFELIFLILERCDDLSGLIQNSDIDEDLKQGSIASINSLKPAFSANTMGNAWGDSVQRYLNPGNINSIRYTSISIKNYIQYNNLNEAEIGDVLSLVSELVIWLQEHQLHEKDFIRQALLDGLGKFKFKLERLKWVGWGYTVQSLREVMGAYLALEKGHVQGSEGDIYDAMYRKVVVGLKAIFEKIGAAKDLTESVEFALKAYGFVTLCLHGGTPIAGLLTHIVE